MVMIEGNMIMETFLFGGRSIAGIAKTTINTIQGAKVIVSNL